MANAGAKPPCHFRWQIDEPLFPKRKLEGPFYTASPTTRWTATIETVTYSMREWHFLFGLACDPCEEGYFLADRLQIDISLDGRHNLRKDEQNYYFGPGNYRVYNIVGKATSVSQIRARQLNINIEIIYRGSTTEMRPEPLLFGGPEDLAGLSESMKEIFRSDDFCDTRIHARDNGGINNVHYCILAARWKNFLLENRIQEHNTTVRTRISQSVLEYILYYMYSGAVSERLLDLGNLPARAELFRVIDRYMICHLYNVFFKDESCQVRKESRDLNEYGMNMPLGDQLARGINVPAFHLKVVETGFQLYFTIQFYMIDPSFDYNLSMGSGYRCLIRVNLELIEEIRSQEIGSNVRRTCWDIHQRVYEMHPGHLVRARNCNFEARGLPLDQVRIGRYGINGGEVRYFIRCTLGSTKGEETVIVDTGNSNQWQTHEERLEVLSNHLFLLQRRQTAADLKVYCRDSEDKPYFVHRAILNGRVPGWRQVLNVRATNPNSLPVADANISDLALRFVLEYMYTGKTIQIYNGEILAEMHKFAARGRFSSLKRFVEKLHQV